MLKISRPYLFDARLRKLSEIALMIKPQVQVYHIVGKLIDFLLKPFKPLCINLVQVLTCKSSHFVWHTHLTNWRYTGYY